MPTTCDDKRKITDSSHHPFPVVAIIALAIIVGGGVSLYLKSREAPPRGPKPVTISSDSSGTSAPRMDPAGDPANPLLFPGSISSGSGASSYEPPTMPDLPVENTPEALVPEPRQNTIFFAASKGQLGEVKKILQKHPGWLNLHDDQIGATPLYWAAARNQAEVVKFLLDKGADPNAVENNGRTPMHTACFAGSLPIVKLLLEYNANLDPVDKTGVTPCFVAIGRGQTTIVAELLDRGARTDLTENSKAGLTPLLSAITSRRKAIAEILIAHGADVNAKSAIGLTPITAAEMAGQTEIVEMLEKAGAMR